MSKYSLFLLGGSYRSEGDGVVLELYGKSPTGESVVALAGGFRPYFELTEPTPDQLERLKTEPEVVSIDYGPPLWVKGTYRPVATVHLHHPWVVPQLRERYHRSGEESSVLACDIPFVHRFIYDLHLGLTIGFDAEEATEEERARYTVARVLRVLPKENARLERVEPFRPPLTYLSFDIENAIRQRTLFTLCGVVSRSVGESAPGEEQEFRLHGSEREILEGFVRVVEKEDPDVITGYNIGGYDIPLLLERQAALGLPELLLGRDRTAPGDAGERLWRIHGRVVADAWWSARRELRPKQESLEYVARTLLGDKKLDVDRRNIEAEWAKDPEAVMTYCTHDARLALHILQRLRSIDKAADLATVAHLPLEEGLNGRTSLFIDALLIPKADERNIGVPPSRRVNREAPIEGGYVHTIRPGLYHWVVVLDFKAMYPSIIIAKNLCFTTLSGEGTTVSPSGAKFLPPETMRGVIPELLEELMRHRDEFRRRAQEETSPELRAYYDGLQAAVKVLMNSFYGVLASSFYRFTNKDIGAAITSFARAAITTVIHELEAEHIEVVYSDTDSVFVRSPTSTLEGAIEFGQTLSRRFSAKGASLEFQSVYESLFSHGAKKRYVGRTAWPRSELIVRGYESRRTDAFDYQVESLNELFELVLQGDTQRALTRARERVAELREGHVAPERLVVARSVRAESEYNEATKDALPFLRVFRQLQSEGYDVIPGMKVAWLVTDASRTPQQVEPWVVGRALTKPPDYAYYAERLAQTLARVTEVFDWDASALLKGGRQQRFEKEEKAPSEPRAELGLDAPLAEINAPAGRKRKSTTLDGFSGQ
ncbi:MAG: DNA polymerase II [Thermoplasmata archaeon]|nr:DNA polymerase II [Thermoplasmata archaeon]